MALDHAQPGTRCEAASSARPEPVPATPLDIDKLIDEAMRSEPDLAACVVLAADTGARRGELCGLRWTRVDPDAAKVRFDRSIGEAGAAYEKDTKNHQHRTVSLSPFAAKVLRDHLRSMRERASCAAPIWPTMPSCSRTRPTGRPSGGRRVSTEHSAASASVPACRTR
jgi:integrase